MAFFVDFLVLPSSEVVRRSERVKTCPSSNLKDSCLESVAC